MRFATLGATNTSGGYEVANSLRFDDGSSDYLNRTPSSNGSGTTATFSGWVKGHTIGQNTFIFGGGTSGNDFQVWINTNNNLALIGRKSSSANTFLISTQVFRDLSAWYHIVAVFDTTNATSGDRARLYVNGERITDFSIETLPSQNETNFFNNTSYANYIGSQFGSSYSDLYLAEAVWIDGQALDPTSFGEFDTDSSVWKPIDVSGLTFGTNGFYLDYEDSGSLGADVSGNGNNFTVNNLTSIDQTTDTPTNNYCTLNPLDVTGYIAPGEPTFSEGNTVSTSSANDDAVGTFGVTQGKWYFEMKNENGGANTDGVGFVNIDTEQEAIYRDNGNFRFGGSDSAYGATWQTAGDIIGVALDLDSTTISFYKNGVSQGNAKTDLPSGTYIPMVYNRAGVGSSVLKTNFGNPAFSISSGNSDANGYGNFEYAVPSGYYALNSKNLAEYG